MCGLALFAFKYPSMLCSSMSSTAGRRLDRVPPAALQRVFGRVFEVARRHKALTGF